MWRVMTLKNSRKQHGQATMEYILVLCISVALLLLVMNRFIRPFLAQMGGDLAAKMGQVLFPSGEDAFHHIRIGR